MNCKNFIDICVFMKIESVANKAEHWRSRYKRNKAQKQQVIAALSWERKIDPPCVITLTRIAPRMLDYDNLVAAFKHIVDAVSVVIYPDLAAGRADGMPGMTWNYKQERREPNEYALRVEVENI
jgi:hypothetical protein